MLISILKLSKMMMQLGEDEKIKLETHEEKSNREKA